MSQTRYNESFIDLMDQLSSLMLKQGELFRSRAYQKAQETIMTFPGDILSAEQLKGKPAIGETIFEKLKEFVATGTLKILEKEKNNPVNIFAEIHGIGPKKAKELVDNGIHDLDSLRKNANLLNDVQKIGLKYHEDILKRIPRSEIQEFEKVFEKVWSEVLASKGEGSNKEKGSFSIVGSYRRGQDDSGDIDVILTCENHHVYITFIDLLLKYGIIIEILSRGNSKCLVIAKLPSCKVFRRVDFLFSPPEEYAFSLLYFTGSKIFNTVMRHHALSLGFTMNEHGLYKMESKKKGDRIQATFLCEKDIFHYLGLVYKSPIERKDGRSIILLNNDCNNTSSIPPIPIHHKTLKIKKKGSESGSIQTKKNVKKHLLIIEEDQLFDKDKKTFLEQVNDFRQKGLSIFYSFTESQLNSFLMYANLIYFNETPVLTDNEYDLIKEYFENRFPGAPILKEVGAPIPSSLIVRNKVVLPYEMPSMDKIKPDTKALDSWKTKYNGDYVLSCKLDGVSGLYSTESESKTGKLYTRGDGKVGLDISHLIPYLNLPKKNNIVIRGEFIIKKKVFLEKYKKEFANPRNLVSGILLQKKIDPKLVDVDFVAYEVIEPVLCPLDQMNFLKNLSVNFVSHQLVSNFDLTNHLLSSYLKDWREKSIYEIDGIIVTDNHIFPRKSGNPEHSFAFKMVLSDQIAEAKVVDVLWSASKDGYLKPRVQIEPIFLGGVQIEFATGFNAAFIQSNKIGVGAVIELIRSGDVIPYIKNVIVPAVEIKMPLDPYEWNETKTDIILKNIEDNLEVREKNITAFFRGLEVEGLSNGNICRLCKAGYTSVPAIINMKLEDYLKVEGFQQKMAKKLFEGIQEKLEKVSLKTFMAASNIFGRGFSDKKLELILESYPDILISSFNTEEKIQMIKNIKGMAEKSAEAFVNKIIDFLEFAKNCGKKDLDFVYSKNISEGIDISNVLFDKQIVMTGFRDPTLVELLEKKGAKLGTSVNKNTFVVIVKDSDFDRTSKIIDAEKLGKPILTLKDFQTFLISKANNIV